MGKVLFKQKSSKIKGSQEGQRRRSDGWNSVCKGLEAELGAYKDKRAETKRETLRFKAPGAHSCASGCQPNVFSPVSH